MGSKTGDDNEVRYSETKIVAAAATQESRLISSRVSHVNAALYAKPRGLNSSSNLLIGPPNIRSIHVFNEQRTSFLTCRVV